MTQLESWALLTGKKKINDAASWSHGGVGWGGSGCLNRGEAGSNHYLEEPWSGHCICPGLGVLDYGKYPILTYLTIFKKI